MPGLKRQQLRRKIPHHSSKSPPPSLTPFEKIKLEIDRTTAHGHPLILPSPYGEYGPVFDVIALFQNAVKRQIIVAYNMLEAMLRSKLEVSHHHLNLFFDWFDTFEDCIFVIFDVEEEHVYPFLDEARVQLPKSLSDAEREKACDKIFSSLQVITDKREKFQLLPAGEAIPNITEMLDVFLHLIVDYYDSQTKLLPQLIFEADIDGDIETELRSRFITALRSKPNYWISIPFVAHWMNGALLKSWKAKYLGPVVGLRFDQWAKRFEALHGSVPHKIFESIAAVGKDDEKDLRT